MFGRKSTALTDPVVEEMKRNKGNIGSFLKKHFKEYTGMPMGETTAILREKWAKKDLFLTSIVLNMSCGRAAH